MTKLNFVCKLHENGCTWNLGAYNSKRHNKWIIKSIRGHHICLVPMLRQDHRQLDKIIAQIIQPIIKTNPTVSIKTLIAEIKTFINYTTSYKKTWLAKQRALEMIHGNWEESYAKLLKLFEALQSCVLGTVLPHGANHIFPIAYAIVEGETTSAWGFYLKNLRRHVTPQINISLISDRYPSIISSYNNPRNVWVTYGSKTHPISFAFATLHKTLFVVTHTQRRCTGDILGIFVRISQVQPNGLINYPNKNEYNASMRGNVGDI
ncbi:hypothetical protein HKD37_05G013544 [Glycine soja]